LPLAACRSQKNNGYAANQLNKKSRSASHKTERPDRFNGRGYLDSLQQCGVVAFFAPVAPEQQSLGGLQHSAPLEQQSLAFDSPKQHSRGGLQHSAPDEQQSLAFAFVSPWQHQLSGQQSKPNEQQSKFFTVASPATYKAPVITIAISAFVNIGVFPQ
jgi:hypothetical protein